MLCLWLYDLACHIHLFTTIHYVSTLFSYLCQIRRKMNSSFFRFFLLRSLRHKTLTEFHMKSCQRKFPLWHEYSAPPTIIIFDTKELASHQKNERIVAQHFRFSIMIFSFLFRLNEFFDKLTHFFRRLSWRFWEVTQSVLIFDLDLHRFSGSVQISTNCG